MAQVKGTDASSGSGTKKTTTTKTTTGASTKYASKATTYGVNSTANTSPTKTTTTTTKTTTPTTKTTTPTTSTTPTTVKTNTDLTTKSSTASSGTNTSGSSTKTSGTTASTTKASGTSTAKTSTPVSSIGTSRATTYGTNTTNYTNPTVKSTNPSTSSSSTVSNGTTLRSGTPSTQVTTPSISSVVTSNNAAGKNDTTVSTNNKLATEIEQMKAPSGGISKDTMDIVNANNAKNEENQSVIDKLTDFFTKNSEAYDRANSGDVAESFVKDVLHALGLDLFSDVSLQDLAQTAASFPNYEQYLENKSNAESLVNGNQTNDSNTTKKLINNTSMLSPSTDAIPKGSDLLATKEIVNAVNEGRTYQDDIKALEDFLNGTKDDPAQQLYNEVTNDSGKVTGDVYQPENNSKTEPVVEEQKTSGVISNEQMPSSVEEWQQVLWDALQTGGVEGITSTLQKMGISYNDALVRAIQQLTPQYQANLKSTLNSLQNKALKSGFYGQLPAEALYQQAVAANEGELQSAIYQLAEDIYNNEYDRELQTAEFNNDVSNDNFDKMVTLFNLLYPNYGKTTTKTTTNKASSNSGITDNGEAYDNGGLSTNTVKAIQQAMGYSASQTTGQWTDEMKVLTNGMDAKTAYTTYVNAPSKTTAQAMRINILGNEKVDENTTVPQYVSNLIKDGKTDSALSYLKSNWNKINLSDRQDIQNILKANGIGYYSVI